ncbi:ABC transporter substrate-binding protein, partial [Acinetobacter baumannii]
IYLHLDSFRDETPMVTDKAGQPLKANPLKDPRVRAALSHAINRKAIVDRIFEGEAIAAGGFLPEGFFGASSKFQPDAYDVELS